jgi:hypothetical protein
MPFDETFVIVHTNELNELTTELYEAMMDDECEIVVKTCEKLHHLIKYLKATYKD